MVVVVFGGMATREDRRLSFGCMSLVPCCVAARNNDRKLFEERESSRCGKNKKQKTAFRCDDGLVEFHAWGTPMKKTGGACFQRWLPHEH